MAPLYPSRQDTYDEDAHTPAAGFKLSDCMRTKATSNGVPTMLAIAPESMDEQIDFHAGRVPAHERNARSLTCEDEDSCRDSVAPQASSTHHCPPACP